MDIPRKHVETMLFLRGEWSRLSGNYEMIRLGRAVTSDIPKMAAHMDREEARLDDMIAHIERSMMNIAVLN